MGRHFWNNMMKMSDTKTGDFIKWDHVSMGDIITLVLPDTDNITEEDIKLYVIPIKDGASTGMYFNRKQYEKVLANKDVTLLKLGVKE